MAREAPSNARGVGRYAIAFTAIAAALSLAPFAAHDARATLTRHAAHSARSHLPSARHIPYPRLDWPLEISDSQYAPVAWADLAGWSEDDHLQAYKAFRLSCKPISAQRMPPADPKALGASLRDPCRAAKAADISDGARAKTFFEQHFLPLRISRLGEDEGFVTGYYEPVIDGSRTQTDVYTVPVYRRPSNLFVRGTTQSSTGLPNKGQVFRKIGRRKLVPYYDRAEIEDGAIAGRGLEICWLKNQTDLLFAQIQGSARIRFEDGSTMRINYDAHNGYPYTAVGRILIDRGIIPKEQMSMQKIREWMDQNPDGAKELRRQNRSYVFFREVQLSDKDEAVGAQGVPLTPGRSIAVDKGLHVYGTPFFIEGELPIESEQSKTPFHRLMIAQDTGSAIVGPARADLYFGAGAEAGKVAGRLRHNMRFAILVPKSLDPVARGRKMPLPDARPSEKIAKLFPQVDPLKDAQKDQQGGAKAADAVAAPGATDAAKPRNLRRREPAQTAVATAVPLPAARPNIEPAGRNVATVTSDAIAAADETSAPDPDPGIVGIATPQAQLERRRARALGERCKTGKTAAEKAAPPQRRRLLHRMRKSRPPQSLRASREPLPSAKILRKPKPEAPPLAPIGRRERSQLSRGRKEIDARLDLHGMTQTRAHRALSSFLQRAHGDGLTFVLVITGKGKMGAESERGVLRRQVPQWLSLPEFRTLVVGFEEAHIGHGGEGAIYVRIRRARL